MFFLSYQKCYEYNTAISFKGPEQGIPCVVFPHREKPVLITGMDLQCTL